MNKKETDEEYNANTKKEIKETYRKYEAGEPLNRREQALINYDLWQEKAIEAALFGDDTELLELEKKLYGETPEKKA